MILWDKLHEKSLNPKKTSIRLCYAKQKIFYIGRETCTNEKAITK